LPFTGWDIRLVIAAGLGLALAGFALQRATRHSR
jgi:ABC-type Fe3+-siderophore transport system permease subunit